MKRQILHFLASTSVLIALPLSVLAQRENTSLDFTSRLREKVLSKVDALQPIVFKSTTLGKYPWKSNIVTTVFWIGESPTGNNPVPNHASSWDKQWARNYGGFDNPNAAYRRGFAPVNFIPRQNPFYIALPYNDVMRGGTKPEASRVIPWFRTTFERPGKTICKDRWLAIRRGGKVCYAQWEDCGPFRTDHWEYVFGDQRPRSNLNQGAGLDVSPAVRDYLGMGGTDVTDWKFVDFDEVPQGPWSIYGDNNTFVQNRQKRADVVVRNKLSGVVEAEVRHE